MKKLNIFFQDWAFGHMVAFKRLLRPFISAGLHKRLGDDDDDLLLLRGGGGGEEGGLRRRQEYAAWAVDSKAISWSFVQERGGFIYK
jgi:hypothetical protein